MTDKDNDGDWVDASGSQLTYTNWAPSQPNGRTYENCALQYDMEYQGGYPWVDYTCQSLLEYVCSGKTTIYIMGWLRGQVFVCWKNRYHPKSFSYQIIIKCLEIVFIWNSPL